MTTLPSRPNRPRRFRADLVLPAAVALCLLTACSSTTSGQGAAASTLSPMASAAAPTASEPAAPSTAQPAPSAPAAPATVTLSAAPLSSAAQSLAPVSADAPVSSTGTTSGAALPPAAPAPVTVTQTQTQTATATVTSKAPTGQDSSPAEAPSTATSSAKNVLGPDGYLGVELGESQPTARLDAIFATTPAVTQSCQDWDTIAAAPISSVLMSATLGIAGISPRNAAGMHTPEGMTVGWTAKQVHAAYPSFSLADVDAEDGGPEIAVPQNARAVYKVRFDGEKVAGFSLLLRDQDCFD